jgi:hypothetical protein
MTIINGANNHNVEDILASIRTSIAGEGTSARPQSGEIQLPNGRREPLLAEEAAEFELPAIFKPGHQAPERQKLLGRLSDALKSTNPADAARPRTVIPFDPPSRNSEPQPPQQQYQPPQPQYQAPQPAPAARMQPAVDRAPPPRQPLFQPQPQPQPQYQQPQFQQQPQYQPQQQPGPEQRDVKRVMPTFFDTRISKLGEMTKQTYVPTAEPPRFEPEPPPALPRQQQPMLPEGNLAHHVGDGIEDAAAQLLRPMLRQWLQENMPKIVEKALMSEAQSGLPPPERK